MVAPYRHVAELEELTGRELTELDLHRPAVDDDLEDAPQRVAFLLRPVDGLDHALPGFQIQRPDR